MGSLDGKKVCVTGKLSESRSAVQEKLKELGASISKSITKSTDLLVAGAKAGSKLAKAEKEGIPVLGQAELDALLGGKSLEEVLGGAAPPKAKAAPAKEKKAAAKPKKAAAAAPEGQPHAGQTFVLTGELGIERSDAKKQLVALGARVTGSVSGKTTALLCGDEPGQSKIAKAESKGIPVVDEAGVERLLNGEPLDALAGPAPAKEESPSERTPLPPIPERADGPYVMTYADSDQVEYEGQFEKGRMVGTWKSYWPSGQLKWQVGWVDGKRQGPIEAWHENGEKQYTGQYLDDEQHGEWTYWYDDGAYFQTYHFDKGLKTGDYVCDERDGSPRARGQFLEGKLDGQWEWWNQKAHERVLRGYRRGAFTGMSEAWYYGGQLAYRKEYRGGGLCGVFEEYYEDGKPKKIGEYAKDRSGLIRMESYDADGKKTVEEGKEKKLPEKLLASESRLEKLAARLKKAKDEFKKDDVLEKAAGEWSLKYPLLLHLFREDLYDLGADWHLWRFLAENTHLLTGEDVAKLLRTAKPQKDYGPHLPGWRGSLDQMVMRVYARDPEPIDAVLSELKGDLATGVKFCLARFGKDVEIGDQAAALAHKMVNEYGVGERILWPNDGGTEVDWVQLFEGHGREQPSEHFGRFLELLTDSDSYEEAMLDAMMEACAAKDYPSDLQIQRLKPGLRRATPEQLVTILDNATLGDQTIDATKKLFFEWREDDAEVVTKIALAMEEKGLRRWPAVACAILKRKEEGLTIPQELLDVLPLEGVSISTMWIDQAIRDALGTDQDAQSDLHAVADAVVFADHDAPGCPRNALLVEALRALNEEELRSKLRAQLDDQYGKQNVAPYLFLLDDEDFWKTAIETIAESDYGGGHTIAYGLGLLPLKALPLVLAGKKKTQKKHQDGYDRAALLMVTRALERGETLTGDQLEHIRFDLGGKYDWNYVMPILRKAITVLPREQGEKVLLKGLESANVTTFARAFRFIGAHPSRKVLEAAMNGLLDREMKLKSEGERDVEAGLKSLPTMYMNERREYVKWLLMNDGGKKLKRVFQQAVGHKDFEALEKEIAEGGKEVAKELDKVDKVVLLAERARKASKGGTQVIYALRTLEQAPAKANLNRTGGLPPGIDAESWPVKDDEPMVHLFTLDLETMPELKNPKSETRSVSFFCYSPNHNEAWEAGNDQTALLKATADQVGEEHEPPEEAEVRSQGHFEAVRIEVPSDVWFAKSGVLDELRGAIYQLGARVLGQPLWLQGDEGGGAGFVMQFDESFVDVNLGDMGIMYVYSDGGFWQCH